jgi:hypothetical protein
MLTRNSFVGGDVVQGTVAVQMFAPIHVSAFSTQVLVNASGIQIKAVYVSIYGYQKSSFEFQRIEQFQVRVGFGFVCEILPRRRCSVDPVSQWSNVRSLMC